ncbi:efflux transporter periplasmic adaptor subunit [Rhodospirillum rubrum]|uniref:efflux RND transporter periplasmic adaptor subunit n=1 Tax=Rhodospirillum rubrum TaxID=1085 RepID=UPI0019049F85|nr:efflux RND transporter periplasmic adaptor subunit [Rhodospirillum rubrum]MBK1664040.1 efflux transporter periplasmic adaptor subunit [Rhodospirillum rubrum]MBK1675484.1 efflux transporter periplasmic adaptor subunit [Rhodospirillum rubrum]
MRILRQAVLATILVLGVGAAVVGRSWLMPDADGKQSAPTIRALPVEVAAVRRATVADRVEAVGTTRAHQAIAVVPLASGRILDMPFPPGRKVNKGDVLVRLDDAAQRADVEEAEATLTQVSRALERARSLRRTQAVAQATVDDLQSNRAAAAARLDRARKDLSDRVIAAPFAGIVGFRELDVGARVSEGERLTTLDDLSSVDVEFAVPEIHFGRLRPGMAIEATSQAFPGRIFTGAIDRIDSRIGEMSRAFRVRAILPNPQGLLPSGLFLTVSIVIEERPALMVPEEAIQAEAGGSVVYVIQGGAVRRQPIVLGQRTGTAVEVRSGLAEGDQVVSRGIQRLRDGSPVTVIGSAS